MTLDLTLSRDALLGSLSHAKDVTDPRSEQHWERMAILTADTWGLRLDASSQALGWSRGLDADIKAEGAIAVTAGELEEKIRTLPTAIVRLQDTNGQLKVSAVGKARSFTIPGLSPAELPRPPALEDGAATVKMSGVALGNLIASVEHAASEDVSRANLHSVRLVSKAGALLAEATNGHRLARTSLAVDGIPELDALLTPRGAEALRRFVASSDAIQLSASSSRLFCSAGRGTLSAALLSATFPTLDKVIPSGGRVAKVDKAALIDALKAISTVGSGKEGIIALSFNDGLLKLSGSGDGSASGCDELPYESTIAISVTLGMNAGYLLGAARSLECQHIDLSVSGELDPIAMRPVDGTFPSSVRVVMPARV